MITLKSGPTDEPGEFFAHLNGAGSIMLGVGFSTISERDAIEKLCVLLGKKLVEIKGIIEK